MDGSSSRSSDNPSTPVPPRRPGATRPPPVRPTGTVTFLFTEVEGSTQLWERHSAWMEQAHRRHETILRETITAHGGWAYKQNGDAFQAAFPTVPAALAAAIAAQRALAAEPWGDPGPLRVRMGLHTGQTEEREDDYVGPLLNRAARLLSAGHGGQILLTGTTAALVHDRLPPGVALRDLGERRLKDLILAEHVFQVDIPGLQTDFPPLRTPERRPHNVPIPPTPLIGRQAEVAMLGGLLERAATRLVTLTGPGGTGKTRLAIEVAGLLQDAYADGVFLVDLAPIADAGVVCPTIAANLGLRETGDRPLTAALQDYLRERTLLLVLDNFEQVADAAPLVGELLAGAPHLQVLVTSRAKLRLPGEQGFHVEPLALPAPDAGLDALAQAPAVALFVARARAARADFALTPANADAVAEICRRLDGLPLAIELAAARSRILPPRDLLARLEPRLPLLTRGSADLPARQQTMRAAITWSYDLLAPDEQQLFRWLSVFPAPFELGDVEGVCMLPGETAGNLLDCFTVLVEQSLVQPVDAHGPPARFVQLATVRELGDELLARAGETEILRAQHAAHYLALAERDAPVLRSADRDSRLDRLEADLDHLRAALTWYVAAPERAAQGLALAGALHWFWYFRGHLTEGRQWLERALDAVTPLPRTAATARALVALGHLALIVDDLPEALRRLEAAADLARALDDRPDLAYTLAFLGLTEAYGTRDPTSGAERLLDQAIQLLADGHDEWGQAFVNDLQADAIYNLGGSLADNEYYRALSLGLYRVLGDQWGITYELTNLGYTAVMQGAYGLARTRLEEVLAGEAAGDHWLAAHAWRHLGDVAVFEQNLAAAVALYQRSLAQYRELGDRGRAANAVRCLGHVALAQGELATAAAHYEESLALAEAVGHRPNMALSLAGLAGVIAAGGSAAAAARLLGAADALRAASHGQLPAADAAAYNRTRAALENALGPETFARLYAEGGAQSETEVVTTEAVRAVLLVGLQPPDEAEAGGTTTDQRSNRD